DLLGADAGTFAELQTIITNARSWDTITLDRDYIGSGTQLSIDKPLTINGNGYTLDADGKSRIFYITGENVTLKNISMKGGYAQSQSGIADKNRRPGGGFIYVNNVGTIVDSCIFNQTTGSGGAIAVMRSDFSIFNSKFYDCHFQSSSNKGDCSGAAINFIYQANFGSSPKGTIKNCYFENCFSNGAGAISSFCSNVQIDNCTFTKCYSRSSDVGGYGGAINLNVHSHNMMIKNCKFLDCNAISNGGAIAATGAVSDIGRNVSIINCSFNNCHAASGGVIYMASQESHVINCTFNNNYASDLGGVFYSGYQNNEFINCSGKNNTAKQGAVIYINAANNLVDGCNFRDNYASTYDIILLNGNNNKLLNSVFVNNTSTETILSTSGTGVVINNSIIIENKGTNIIYSATSNGVTADYNWFGNSEDNYNTRPQCNNYNNVKVTKWYYLNLMAEQSIAAENQDVTMNMGLHGLYDSNTGKKTESLDYNTIPFYLVPDEFLPGEFTLTTDNGQTSVPSKVFTNRDCTFTYTPENMDSGTVTGTNSFGQTIFETITVIKAGSFTDLYNRINYAEENNVLELPYKFEYDDTYDPTHLDTLYGLDDVSGGLPIDKNISINGNYNTINALNQVDIFNITSNVGLENVNLRNGQINNNGNLTLKNVNHRGSEYSVVNNGNLYLEKDYDLMTIKNNGMI
ncbi:MAG: right-handed parallel beta-helix repeat-containing protein, partial [Methanobrevibacter sp.]|uniref:right-handed parallel beta-helix repeat-containing protein n=1 Tax=Methanobrevibacter sp. TaxID=66852 RepID=UPI001B23BBC9